MPYIPEKHKKYNLLPRSVSSGGEVFSYPSRLLNKLSQYLPEENPLEPYQCSAYEEYYNTIEHWIEYYKTQETILKEFIRYKELIQQMNIKENWSVLQYIGPDMNMPFGLQKGKHYYWPCSIEHPYYEGVIDNEEFTSYLYPTDSDLWKIAEDPTGMAYRTIFNGANSCLKEKYYKIISHLKTNMGK